MKRTVLIFSMLAVALSLVGAHGFTGMRLSAGGATEAEEVRLTGRIRLVEDEFPVLVVDGEEYTLRISPSLVGEIEVTNNREVSVEGFAIERSSYDLLGSDTIVHVRVFQVGDERYIASEPAWGRCGGTDAHRDGGVRGMPRSSFGRSSSDDVRPGDRGRR